MFKSTCMPLSEGIPSWLSFFSNVIKFMVLIFFTCKLEPSEPVEKSECNIIQVVLNIFSSHGRSRKHNARICGWFGAQRKPARHHAFVRYILPQYFEVTLNTGLDLSLQFSVI